MNRVELIGALVREPEQKQLESGFAFTRFTLAVNGTRYSSSQRQQVVTTNYIGCTCWGETGARAMSELQRGDEVHVLGMLDQKELQVEGEKKDGHTRVAIFTYEVVRRSRREV